MSQIKNTPVLEEENKSSVQVAVRVRPLLPKERLESLNESIIANDNNNKIITPHNNSSLEFDKVFSKTSKQITIFNQMVIPLLDTWMKG